MIFINIFDMKTESTKTQEKKLETLEETVMTVLNTRAYRNRLLNRPDVQYLHDICLKLQMLELPAEKDSIGIQCQELAAMIEKTAVKWGDILEKFSMEDAPDIGNESGNKVADMPPLPPQAR